MPTPSRILNLRTLPGTRQTVAYQDGGQFPVLTLAPDATVIAVLRGGAGHLGLEGRVEIIRSHDTGRTWSPPEVVADSEWDDRNPALGTSHQGTIVLSYHRQGQYDSAGKWAPTSHRSDAEVPIDVRVTRSFDNGLSWETPALLGVDQLRAGSPYGKIVSLPDGTLLMAVYGGPQRDLLGARMSEVEDGADCSYLVRSHDDGRTWGEPSLIGPRMNETALLALPDGDVLAVMRGVAPAQALHVTRSSDGGHTWSPPVQLTDARQHPADVVQLSNGDLLLTYGNRTAPFRIEGRVSRDGGSSWLDLLLTVSAPLYGYAEQPERITDLGYPSSVVHQGQGVTVYYYKPSVRRAWREDDGARQIFYQSFGYYAVAVTWDEAELIAAIDKAME